MLVADGVTLNAECGYVGLNPGSTGAATVSGLGSTWNVSNDLLIGSSGSGSLRVDSGASIVTGQPGFMYNGYIGLCRFIWFGCRHRRGVKVDELRIIEYRLCRHGQFDGH